MKNYAKTRAVLALLLLVATLGIGTTLAGQQRTDRRERKNGTIALSGRAVADGQYVANFQIATRPKHGGPYTYITNLPDGAFDPDFTPNGKTIVFWSPDPFPDGIFSIPTEGGTPVQIQTGCGSDPNCLGDDNPAVSPDGRELLTVRALGPIDDQGCPAFVGIYRFAIDGTHAKQISRDGSHCVVDVEPRWSPDGHKIIFQYQDGTGVSSLWIMGRDGSNREQITPPGLDIGNPDLSPDQERFVFQSPAEPTDDQHPQQVYTIERDGTHVVELTHYLPVAGLTIKSFGTRWSPDGRKILFSHVDSTTTLGPDGLHHADLFVMNADGSEIVQLDFNPDAENGPAWGARR